ncbi:hypothetical protein [Streptomyces diastatochromogenes]|uniref:RNA polymerase subunit sigma-24 n=1 Tax=Streptomyces diastatochromogenes TaxID=42236 RepID=A0A233SY00_STRDA|nr:hypothetical protein [Streptomyces diastatochromogenes]MCZ0991769.1 hypothetical protein [Streptomyces diastatochromogenes]OXZ00522.1 hypothetical protein BEK98_00155 [Streptomyces diastatochromogenes]
MAAFAAFRERQFEPYLQYAALRIGQPCAAEKAVAAAFTELAVSWTVVLGSSGPAAVAWDILHDHIDHALGLETQTSPSGRTVRSLQLDAHVLHRRLRLSSERVAEVLGVALEDLASLLPSPAAPME